MPVLSNPRHERFAQALAKGASATDAYATAGYAPNRQNAARLTTNDDIRTRVAELTGKGAERAEIDIARVLRELVRLGTSDLRQAFDGEGRLLPPEQWPDDLAAAISSIEVVTKPLPGDADEELDAQPHGGALARKRNPKVEYVHKIKLWDKNSALEKIAKHLGMFVERHEYGVSSDMASLMERIAAHGRRIHDPS